MKKTRNRFEYQTQKQLSRAKVVFEYESEQIAYLLAGHYTPDFIVQTPTGKIYIECKGYLRPEDKRKLVAVKRQHPAMDLRILFYPFKSPKRKQQYIKWAIRNGLRYAINKIPKEWLDGL